ncbi:ComEA family DNA-binding protein [Nocardioides sp.]|uniref:ComEA family DNA-binding protein n=1 Tax=Nocardioides sp. TaxID=35761 RepID=UPI0027331E9C|nr:ComEA family DNA-binding protein [Nocardioides sp.]MDP3893521.1 ComEA family DNA-binding protein [Nocardioides sp.]
MRSRRSQQEHEQAVSRRLAQLSAELATTRGEALAPAAGGEWWDGHTRVAPARAPLVVVPPPEAEPPAPEPAAPEAPAVPVVPVPGRHAARRGRRLLADALPETLHGRVGLGPGQVAVLAVIVALGLAATAWWVVRGDAETVAPPAPALAAGSDLLALPVSEAPAETPGAAAGSETTVTVDVAGKVRRPGIAVLDAGARVVDALEAAGGARPGVDLSTLNLARVLVDGEQILVGRPAAPVPALPGGAATSSAVPGALVDLNRASQAELETLPEVGPVTAAAILAWRDEHGGFSAIAELLEVDGIGDVTLAQIAPHVTV